MRKRFIAKAHHTLFFAWFVCSLAALFYTYEYMLRIEPGIMATDLRAYFSLSAGGLGLLASMYYWGYTPLQLVVGLITDYFGARRVLVSAIALCVIGVFSFGFTSSYLVASISRFFVGVGSAFAFVGALKLAANWLPRRHFAFFVGLSTALGMIGAMFGETAMSWVVESVGWHRVIWESVWLGIILIGLFLIFVYEKHEILTHFLRHERGVNFKTLSSSLVKLIANKTMLQAGLIGCATYLSLSLFAEQWGNLYVQKILHIDAEAASYYVDLVFFGWLIGSPFSGYLSEKVHSRRWVLLVGSILALLSFLPIVMIPTDLPSWLLATLLFLFALFCSAEINCFAIARDLVETKLAATAVGLMNAMVMVSGMIIQPLFAYCLDWFSLSHNGSAGTVVYSLHSFQKALLIIPVFLALSVITAWRMSDSYAIGEGMKQKQRIRL